MSFISWNVEREIQGDQEGCPDDGSMVYYGKYRVFLNK